MNNNKFRISGLVIGCIFLSQSALAQVPRVGLGQIDPGRVERRLKAAPPAALSTPDLEVVTTHEAPTVALPDADKITFKLARIDIDGNSIYTQGELQQVFVHQMGRTISLADLTKIVEKITLKYRNDGYVISRAILPPQEIKHGIVRVQIVEGFIDRVLIKGDLHGQTYGLLQGYGDHIRASRPLHISVLERYALLANDIPGYHIQTVITPSERRTGGADLTFVLSDHKFYDGNLVFDNRSSKVLGREEISFAGYFHNLTAGSTTGFRSLLSDDFDKVQYYEGSHFQHIGTDGMTIFVIADHTETNPALGIFPGFTTPFNTPGRATTISVDGSYPWIRRRKHNLTFLLRFKAMDSKTAVFGTDIFSDHLRSLRAGAVYDFVDSYRGVNLLAAEVSRGLDILAARANPPSRQGGDITYTKVTLDASRFQPLPNRFSVYLVGRAQVGFNHLLSTEEIGFGGKVFGRAYDPSEFVGDSGLEGSAEVRYDYFPDWTLLEKIQFFGYTDGGYIWNRQLPPTISLLNQPRTQTIYSVGIGARFFGYHYFSAEVELAKPMNRIVAAEGNKDARVFFAIVGEV